MTAYELAGRIKFGGIEGVARFSMTRSRGIQPAVIQLTMPVIPILPDGPSTLLVSDGVRTLEFPECAVQSLDMLSSGDGFDCVITLLDYRWKWAYGKISGLYNVTVGGVIEADSKRKLINMAKDCLFQMGVSDSNVEALKDVDVYPHRDWQFENPAEALESLIAPLGFVVCPRIDGSVVIAKHKTGATLPRIIGADFTTSIAGHAFPSIVQCYGAPTLIECTIEIGDPCGIERSRPLPTKPVIESIVPIDELSYKPPQGWAVEDPGMFPNVGLDVLPTADEAMRMSDWDRSEKELELQRVRGLAMESVWKYFRFNLEDLSLDGNRISTIRDIEFVDHLVSELIVEYKVQDGRKSQAQVRRQQPFVYGQFYDQKGFGRNNIEELSHDWANDAKLMYRGGFHVDGDRGVIIFSDPVFLIENGGDQTKYVKPKLFLRCGVNVRNGFSRTYTRSSVVIKTGVNNNLQLPVRTDARREIVLDMVDGKLQEKPDKDKDNKTAFERIAKEFAEAQLARLMPTTPETGVYQGFMPIELDGSIAQVSYEIDGAGFASTKASFGMEHSYLVPSHEERMKLARQDAFIHDRMATWQEDRIK